MKVNFRTFSVTLLSFLVFFQFHAQLIVDNESKTIIPSKWALKNKGQSFENRQWDVYNTSTILIDEEHLSFWAKYEITNYSKDSIVVLQFDHWAYVDLFYDGKLIGKSGKFLPFNERKLGIGNKVLIDLVLQPNESISVTAKLKASLNSLTLPVGLEAQAQTNNYTWLQDFDERKYLFFFLGIFLFILLFNIFVTYVTMSMAYLWYVLLIAINFFALPHNFGYTIEYYSFFETYPQWHPFIDVIVSSVFGFVIMAFTSEFLNVREHFPRAHKLFKFIIFLLIIVPIPSFFGASFIAYNISSLIGLFTFAVVLTVAIMAVVKRVPSSLYFLLAFSFFIIGMFVFLFTEIGILQESIITKYAMQIGACIEATLFAIALGDRIKHLQKTNKNQQAQLIAELKKNELLQLDINEELEQKVENRTIEIKNKNEELEYSNQQITDSLNYAKNLQSAILDSHNALEKNSIESFVYFKPRDIVSGDFYWSHQVNEDAFIWVTADCTGHGVPGALMSIVGNILLNKIVVEKGTAKVDLILSQLRDGVVDTMSSPSSGKKRLEGIDMSACRLNRRTNTLKFSGANSSLWVISDSKLIEIKGEKQPVGYHHKMDQPFTEQVLSVNKGDCIYTFTDGILDQFGGPDNKKFGYPRFRKLLLKASTLNILEQKELIHEEIKSWKGDVEQLDDLTVIGLIV